LSKGKEKKMKRREVLHDDAPLAHLRPELLAGIHYSPLGMANKVLPALRHGTFCMLLIF
jgi:hypothetical protein